MTTEPWRPAAVETTFYEPDERAVIAVLPGALLLDPGDIVELDDPPRVARVLSSRLQLRRGEPARVLVVLDVGDPEHGDTAMAMMADADASLAVTEELDDELEQLTDEVEAESTPDT
jgi:hypothetical protein